MRKLTVRLAVLWTLVLSCAAFARVHFRSLTTGVAYDLGQLKNAEGRLLEDRSNLKGELARLTTKKRLEELSDYKSSTPSKEKVTR